MLDDAFYMRDRSAMASDPLSDVLELVRARCSVSGRMVAGGAWARRFDNLNAIKLCAGIEGASWCFMEGMGEPARFEAGDVLVMNGTRTLVLASDPALVADAAATPLVQDADGIYRVGQGEGFAMLGGAVQIDERRLPLLLDGLPPLLHVKGAAPEAAALGWLLGQIVQEMQPGAGPGRSLIVAELAQILFVQTLRAYLAHAPAGAGGWLTGLGDEQVAPALNSMHADPARDWSVEDLARQAGMSRTSFAVRFREVMGAPPLTYLTTWRMHLAERDLRAGASVAEAANAIGYTSESAFSHAFKRTIGLAPGQCRRAAADDNGEDAASRAALASGF
jgi:AraC-like DNA-binding protein